MKLKYTGETGSVRIGDHPCVQGELVEVEDHDVEAHLALGMFEYPPASEHIHRKAKSPVKTTEGAH